MDLEEEDCLVEDVTVVVVEEEEEGEEESRGTVLCLVQMRQSRCAAVRGRLIVEHKRGTQGSTNMHLLRRPAAPVITTSSTMKMLHL